MKKQKNKIRLSFFEVVAILSATGLIGWIITDFFGGMVLYLIAYWIIVFPIILLYVVSFVETLISLIMNGSRKNKTKLVAHGTVILVIILFNLYHSELFRPKRILTATLRDDLYHYTLIFRENGRVENRASGIFGFSETFNGTYLIQGDKIIFTKKPYDNDFIPDTLLIDKTQGAIFMEKDKDGEFIRTKQFLNHFEIE